jgi:hypothetical protein
MPKGMGTRLTFLAASSFLLASGNNKAFGQDFWADTFLLDVYMGSNRTKIADALSKGGYELSSGEFVEFRDWYTPKSPDITLLLLKQVTPNFGIIWGVSKGEKGEKYRIYPALQLGFIYQYVPFEDAIFSIKATYPFFGNMVEKTCTADYGDLGSRLIDFQSQKMTVAARATADRKVVAHLS